MKIHDITVAISEGMPIYKADPRPVIEPVSEIAAGGHSNVSKMFLGLHTGTHVDAPSHFIEGGLTVDQIDLDKLVGSCRVVEIDENIDAIAAEHLADLNGVTRVLFKTRNSRFWDRPELGFRTDYTYISPEAARALVAAGVKLVGIDYLSVENPHSEDFATHITLLSAEAVILEGIDLREVTAGNYEIVCMPLKYRGGKGDGAPARTVLIER